MNSVFFINQIRTFIEMLFRYLRFYRGKIVLTYVYDALLWVILALYTMGGVEIAGKIRFAYVGDLWRVCAIGYIILRIFWGIRLSDTTLGRSTISMMDGVIKVIKNRSFYPIKGLSVLSVFLHIIALFSVFMFFTAPIFKYWSFGNYIFDLGTIDNAIYNASINEGFKSWFVWLEPCKNIAVNYFPENHLNFGLYFFALIYKIIPRTEVLLFFQSLALLSALIPLYKVGDYILPKPIPRWLPLVFYWTWDSVHRINLWDFHEHGFSIPFSIWALYFIEKKKILQACVFMFLVAIWREDFWWLFSAIAIYGFIKTRNLKIFLPLALLGFAVLPFYMAVIQKVKAVGNYYSYLNGGVKDLFLTILTRPWIFIEVAWSNLKFFKILFWNTGGGVFLFSKFALVTVIPPLAFIVFSTNPAFLDWKNHYVGSSIGPVCFASMLGCAALYKYLEKIKKNLGMLAVQCFLAISLTNLDVSEISYIRRGWSIGEDILCYRKLINEIPKNVHLLVRDPIGTHLNKRRWVSIPTDLYDQTEAEWIITDQENDLETVGLIGEKRTTPWRELYRKCGFIIAKREGS